MQRADKAWSRRRFVWACCGGIGLTAIATWGWTFVPKQVAAGLDLDLVRARTAYYGEDQIHYAGIQTIAKTRWTTYFDRDAPPSVSGEARASRYFDQIGGRELSNDVPDWVQVAPHSTDPDVVVFMISTAQGWPFRAVVSHTRESLSGVQSGVRRSVLSHESLWISSGGHRFPLDPIPGGLFANLGIYVSVWYAVLSIFDLSRSHLRRYRGRCPLCTYDLAGDLTPGCTECGWNREPATA